MAQESHNNDDSRAVYNQSIAALASQLAAGQISVEDYDKAVNTLTRAFERAHTLF